MRIRCFTLSALLFVCLCSDVLAQDTPGAKTEPPVSPAYLGIVVDCSGSQRLQLDRMVGLIKHIAEILGDDDEAFVVRFVDVQKISVVQEFTRNKTDIGDAAEGLYIEGGQTALVDAVDFAARYMADNKAGDGTRSLVLITDGEDRSSSRRIEEAIALLKEKQIRVFAFGIADVKASSKILDKFTKETGGRSFMPRTTSDLSNAVLELAKLMRGTPLANK